MSRQRKSRNDYTIGWVCAVPIEKAAALAILDEEHEKLPTPATDTNSYSFGQVGEHNVVIACLPAGRYGTVSAASVASQMRSSFPSIRFGLMVGIGGGVPNPSTNDIRLGDVVISQPTGDSSGVIQYDFGKTVEHGKLVRTGFLNAPPTALLNAVADLQAVNPSALGTRISDLVQKGEESDDRFYYPGQDTDRLYETGYGHASGQGRQNETCATCDSTREVSRPARGYDHPKIHYGLIASGNQVMKDSVTRDRIGDETGIICFEMEAAGLMNDFPCLVVRGICDYSDSHKNKRWQPYAGLVAAACTKEILSHIPIAATTYEGGPVGSPAVLKIKEINTHIPFQPPMPRNRHFTGREDILQNINQHFSKWDQMDVPCVYALTGTGGIGKTQITLEYMYRSHDMYNAVFWVSAASEETVRNSFIDIMQRIVEEQSKAVWSESTPDYDVIAQKLGIPGLVNGGGIVSTAPSSFWTLKAALFRWLSLSGNHWLLAFDNADDLETFEIREYLPISGNGSILITSRRPEFSQVAEQADIEGLEPESAMELLLKLIRTNTSADGILNSARILVEKLGYMPLAISHAGYYIQETKISIEQYVSRYDTAFTDLQSRKPKMGWNYRNDTAATAWEISFSQVDKQNPHATRLLLTCSYFNPAEINLDLWVNEASDETSKYQYETSLLILASYSLIKISCPGVFSIHPVVHYWARERMKGLERLEIIDLALGALGPLAVSPKLSENSTQWDPQARRSAEIHFGYFSKYIGPRLSQLIEYAKPKQDYEYVLRNIYRIAVKLSDQRRYDTALEWYEELLSSYKELSNKRLIYEENEVTLTLVHNIGLIYELQENFEMAMQWYQRALESKERNLGKDDPSIVMTLYNIGLLKSKAKIHDESFAFFNKALMLQEKCNKNDPFVLQIYDAIGLQLQHLGRDKEAITYHEKAIAGQERLFGKEHPLTLDSIHGMGCTLNSQERYSEAEEWFRRALLGREKVLGPDDPATLFAMNNLGIALGNQGKYQEALPYHQRALAAREKVLGEDHSATISTICNVASIFFSLGEFGDAISWFKRALMRARKVFGEADQRTSRIVDDIVLSYQRQDRHEEAIEWYKEVLANREKVLGADHPVTLQTQDHLVKLIETPSTRIHPLGWLYVMILCILYIYLQQYF